MKHSLGIFLAVLVCGIAWTGFVPSSMAEQPPAKESAAANADDVHDLPITEVADDMKGTDKLGIFISGDGGWWTLDNAVSQEMATHGVPVIGISSHRYFATARTPDSTAADMARALRHYMKAWKKERLVLMGYSLGAEIIPFVASRLPDDLRTRVVAVVMISPSKDTMFEFHTSDWIHTPKGRTTYPVQPEIEKLYSGPKVICATSDGDPDCICGKLDASKAAVIERKGDHHYGGDYKGLGEAIWDAIKDLK